MRHRDPKQVPGRVLLSFLLLCAGKVAGGPAYDAEVLRTGAPAPELSYVRLSDGHATSLADAHRDKIVVLEFWATWCAPCQPAIDELQKLAVKFADRKDQIEFLTISIDGEEDRAKGPSFTGHRPDLVRKVAAHVTAKGWMHVINGWSSHDERKTWPIHMVPLTFVIDANGNLHVPTVEAKPPALPERLEDIIDRLLKK
jgi:thiol-disulfide isomerase/thioredoxin